jgi:hypothetical protein
MIASEFDPTVPVGFERTFNAKIYIGADELPDLLFQREAGKSLLYPGCVWMIREGWWWSVSTRGKSEYENQMRNQASIHCFLVAAGC